MTKGKFVYKLCYENAILMSYKSDSIVANLFYMEFT